MQDDDIDEALRETFPASDPPANTVETGIGRSSPASAVRDNPELNRFELPEDGETAFLVYERSPDALVLIHTEVPDRLRGRHLGEQLVVAALDVARRERRRVVAVCPFVRAYLRRHPIVAAPGQTGP
jgi:predicted GNAT family acetyltransferase